LFLSLTPEDVETEFWAHHYADNSGKGEEFEDDDLDIQALAEGLENGGQWEEVISDNRT
jgi:hypothetical protein